MNPAEENETNMNYARVLSSPLKKDNYEVIVTLTKYYALVRAGAKWGDTETFDMEEWNQILEQRERARLSLLNSPYCYTFDELIEEGVLTRAVIEPEPEEEPEPEAEPYRPPCEVCGIYLSHSSPPADFKGRNLCCLWCSMKKGASHGERCQRCPLTKPKTNTEYTEY
jgi:hypothetical protein